MIEIKCRGKGIYGQYKDKWVYGYYWYDGQDPFIRATNASNNIVDVQVDLKTVGRYTGAKDLKKIEIYEDDIVKYYNGAMDPICKIEWYQTMACFTMDSKHNSYDFSNYVDVIGNIHDV